MTNGIVVVGGGGNNINGTKATASYAAAKTSVWWDIENCRVPYEGCDPNAIAQNISKSLVNMGYCGPLSISAYGDTNSIPAAVQNALSSTGISLNHVPAGVKDASDKKILVDMLFWAVDNPAPANYLLISGDRDFSNALHQLRMRRYNILLAQTQYASKPLIAAAKSVWLWATLLAGGPPLMSGESQQLFDNNSYTSNSSSSNAFHIPVCNPISIMQPVESYSGNSHLGNPNKGRGIGNRHQGKTTRRNLNQVNGSKALSLPVEHHNNSHQHDTYSPNVSLSGPSQKFVHGNPAPSWSNSNNQYHYSESLRPNNFSIQPAPRNMYPPPSNHHTYAPPVTPPRPDGPSFPSKPPINVPDIGNLITYKYPSSVHNPPTVKQRNGELRHNSITRSSNSGGLGESQNGHIVHKNPSVNHDTQSNGYPCGPKYPSSSSAEIDSTPGSKWGTLGCPKPSEYVQGLQGVILLALDTLKNEKIRPNEANITDCIQYWDPKYRNTEIKKALESAIEQQMVVKHISGNVQLYSRKNEKLWQCVNTRGGDPIQYSKVTWDAIQNFLASPAGRSAIMASQCEYEAGIILKSLCLKELALGDILQILDIVITIKKWIVHKKSGWQPISITLDENQH